MITPAISLEIFEGEILVFVKLNIFKILNSTWELRRERWSRLPSAITTVLSSLWCLVSPDSREGLGGRGGSVSGRGTGGGGEGSL